MQNSTFTGHEVLSAYKKLKHYFYHDNTSLFIRKTISDFEESITGEQYTDAFKQKMESIADKINTKPIEWWQEYFKENVKYRLTPKTFLRKEPVILTNRAQKDKLDLSRINIFIDATVEIHIISVLWLMYAGRFLSHQASKNNYAYQLELSDDDEEQNIVNGLRLYKPYFIQYQNWRDNAITKAEQLLNEKKDVVLLSLDIKNYFNSVRINLMDWKHQVISIAEKQEKKIDTEKISKVFELLNCINIEYTSKIKEVIKIDNTSETILPIGLLSSGLLGNLYLNKFDEIVKEKLNPAYYGRYVDDILFVFSEVEVKHNAIYPINDFLSKYFVERQILEYSNLEQLENFFQVTDGVTTYREPQISKDSNHSTAIDINYLTLLNKAQQLKFHIKELANLTIQSSKVILQSYDHKESKAVINKFKKKLEEKRSEFRFLPDEDKVDTQFDEEAFSLQYSDSVNKLRSIKEFSEDKYGASKYLASKIFASNYSNDKPDQDTIHQILSFFQGVVCMSFHSLWEKVVTYFLINEQPSAILKFHRQVMRALEKINLVTDDESYQIDNDSLLDKLKSDMNYFFEISIAVPLALIPDFRFSTTTKNDIIKFESVRKMALEIRRANMFRHSLVSIPVINYTRYASEDSHDIINIDEINVDSSKLSLDPRLVLLSPRYVHFHEMNILEIYKTVYSINESNINSTVDLFDRLPNEAFNFYWAINYEWRYVNHENTADRRNKLKKEFFEINPIAQNTGSSCKEISIKSSRERINVNKKIAIANIKVDPSNIDKSILRKPNVGRDRRQILFKLINLVEKEKCNLFVLPEVSVPYPWIKLLAYQSQKRNIGIIAGLEHWINKAKFAFNFMATILPIHRGNYSTCLIKIRLKNHYSHEEKRHLKGYRLLIPGETINKNSKSYDLFHWDKTYFSVYNCFELADIDDRALFKSKVDYMIASEYNRDTEYFSEIAGSWVRDIHCYFIQVNSSDFGDSRLLKPAKSFARDIIQIKGGNNSTILVGDIDVDSLRKFQYKSYELQKDELDKNPTYFKPTPPDFNHDNVLIRINNKKFTD